MNNPTTSVVRSAEVEEAIKSAEWCTPNVHKATVQVLLDYIAQLESSQPKPQSDEGLTNADYEEVLADHRRLVRELDVLLNGEHGAAKQASLCDIVSQVKSERLCLYRHTGTHPNDTALSQSPVPTSGAVEVPSDAAVDAALAVARLCFAEDGRFGPLDQPKAAAIVQQAMDGAATANASAKPKTIKLEDCKTLDDFSRWVWENTECNGWEDSEKVRLALTAHALTKPPAQPDKMMQAAQNGYDAIQRVVDLIILGDGGKWDGSELGKKVFEALGPAKDFIQPPAADGKQGLLEAEIRTLETHKAQLMAFAKWAIGEGPWDGCDLDGGDVQDKAVSLGLLVAKKATTENEAEWAGIDCVEEGEEFLVLAGPLAQPASGGGDA